MTTATVFLAVALSLGTALFLGEIVDRLGEPVVLAEIVTGVLLGTHVFGVVRPTGSFALLATIGGMLLLFDAGYEELDLSRLRRGGSTVALLFGFGVGLPGLLGGLLALGAGYDLTAAVVLGLALSVTSIGITARTFLDLDQLDTPYGNHVVGAAVGSEITALIAFSLFLTARGVNSTAVQYLQVLGGVAAFFGGAFLLHRFVIGRLSQFVARSQQPGAELLSIMALLFLFGYAAEAARLDVVVGGLVAGIIVGEERRYREVEVRESIIGIAYGVFVPLLFVNIGAQLDPTVLLTADPLLIGVVVGGLLSKVAGGYVGARLSGYRAAEAHIVGAAMMPRAGVELVIVSGARAIGVVDDRLFSAVLALVFVSVLLTPLVLRRLIHR